MILIKKRERMLILTFVGIIFLWMFMAPIQTWIEEQSLSPWIWLLVGGIGTFLVLALGVKVL